MEVLACPHCERMFNAAPALLGKMIRCRGCRKPFRIPDDPTTADLGPESPEPRPRVLVAIECVVDGKDARRCPSCGRPFTMQPRFAGKRIRCRGCRVPFMVAPTTQSVSADASRPADAPGTAVPSAGRRMASPAAPAAPPAEVPVPPVIYEDSGDVLDILPRGEAVLVAVRPRRIPRSQPGTAHALAPLLAVVLGGITALPVTQLILWWGFGQDPLRVGRSMPAALKVVVPEKFRR